MGEAVYVAVVSYLAVLLIVAQRFMQKVTNIDKKKIFLRGQKNIIRWIEAFKCW